MFALKVDNEIEIKLVHPYYAQELFNIVMENKEHIGEWLDWIYKYQSIDDSLHFINSNLEKYSKGETVECFILYNGKLVGGIGYNGIKKTNNMGEIGYWLDKNYTGKGIMIKCVKTMVNHGFNFLNLNKILIRTATKNEKSANIPKNLGFKEEGILRADGMVRDKYQDSYYFGLLKSEWNSRLTHNNKKGVGKK